MTTEESQTLHIMSEGLLLLKSKHPHTLIKLIEDYELDPECGLLSQSLINLLIFGYMLKADYKGIKHLCERYQLSKTKENAHLQQLYVSAIREDLHQWSKVYTVFVDQSLKGNLQKMFVGLPNCPKDTSSKLDRAFQKAKVRFSVAVLSKYYINLEVSKVTELVGLTKEVLELHGCKVKEGFLEFNSGQNQENDPEINRQLLSKKVKHLAIVSDLMAAMQ